LKTSEPVAIAICRSLKCRLPVIAAVGCVRIIECTRRAEVIDSCIGAVELIVVVVLRLIGKLVGVVASRIEGGSHE